MADNWEKLTSGYFYVLILLFMIAWEFVFQKLLWMLLSSTNLKIFNNLKNSLLKIYNEFICHILDLSVSVQFLFCTVLFQ